MMLLTGLVQRLIRWGLGPVSQPRPNGRVGGKIARRNRVPASRESFLHLPQVGPREGIAGLRKVRQRTAGDGLAGMAGNGVWRAVFRVESMQNHALTAVGTNLAREHR